MTLVVQKFGGSSVADVERIRNVAKIIIREKNQGHQVVVVVSAMGKTTDSLISLAKQICPFPSEREMDMLVSTGEQVSVSLLAMALHAEGVDAVSFTGAQVGIKTDSFHTKARILEIKGENIFKALKKNNVVIIAGFQGIDANNNITTLGRGGSDTTAVAIAAAIKADVCDIYTDVDGVFTADPRIVPEAFKLPTITYDEMLELAAAGAKVMHGRSIEFAKKYHVIVQVRSSFEPDKIGTFIQEEGENMENPVITGITSNKNEAKISILGVPDKPGIAAQIFTMLANNNLNIDVIIQNASEQGMTDISCTIPREDLRKGISTSEKIVRELGARGFSYDEKIAKISIIGVGMKSNCGVAAVMFKAMADNKINIRMISTSEIKVSIVIDLEQADTAVRALHKAFRLNEPTMREKPVSCAKKKKAKKK
ncbi:MAG: aspartate kinase [Candidatus Aureabacteria bacterium]|nr:aspartate kinase [Candidatus Auribacterota bacterium]